MSDPQKIAITVNGKLREAIVPRGMPLIEFLQDELDLTGTKFCCGIGVCRACTVAVWRTPGSVPDVLLTCVTKAVDVDGQSIRTVEGLAGEGSLTPLQQAFLDDYAFQCGYSTPGFLMAGEVLLQHGALRVVADLADHRNLAAELGDAVRLVGALAARIASKRFAGHGLARIGKAFHADDQIGVQRLCHQSNLFCWFSHTKLHFTIGIASAYPFY